MRTRLQVLAAFVALVTSIAGGAPQAQQGQNARADAAISGVIVDETTKSPIADAIVTLGAMTGPTEYAQANSHQLSDARGRFVFTGLPAGRRYTIGAARPGYFDGRYGGETYLPIAVGDGEWFKDVTVALRRPGSISGRVIDERGEPVIGVYVRVVQLVRVAGHDQYAVGPLTTTDDRGIYRAGRLTPGRYVVMVLSWRASVPSSTSAATLVGMSEQAAATAKAAGRQIPVTDPLIDDDSTTRVIMGPFPIPPPPVNGRAFTYPIAYSGGATLSSASVVELDPGVERSGVDIRLEPQPAVRISGTLQGPADALKGVSLRLLPEGAEDMGLGSEAGTALVASDGSFTFAGVPAGSYTLLSLPQINSYTTASTNLSMFYGPQLPRLPGATGVGTIGNILAGMDGVGFSSSTLSSVKYWARTSVAVGANGISGLIVPVRPTLSVSGRLISEIDPSQPTATEPPRFVNLETATGAASLSVPRSVYNRNAAAGEFVIDGVLPGLYQFRGDSSGWMIKSVIANGRDVTYTPLDTSAGENISGVVVTFTTAVQALAGTAIDSRGLPVFSATVAIFPVESAQWTNYGMSPPRIRSVRSASTGAYRFKAVPAGDYYLIALPESQSSAWQQPDFFQRASAVATRVTIAWGETKTVTVKTTEVR